MRYLAPVLRAFHSQDSSKAKKSKRIVIVILIVVCFIVVLLEEWLTDNQLSISSKPSTNTLNDGDRTYKPSPEISNYNPKHTNITLDRCWLDEYHTIIKPCSLCAIYELETTHSSYRSNVKICSKTGYKELVECSRSGPVERACSTNWKQYLTFLSLVSMSGGISGLLTKHRQTSLRDKSLARFRKQSDSDDSQHTLIDMG